MLDARRTIGSLLIAMVVSFFGALLLRWIDTPAIWFYVFGATVTTGALVQAFPELSSILERPDRLNRLGGERIRLLVTSLLAAVAMLILANWLNVYPFDPATQTVNQLRVMDRPAHRESGPAHPRPKEAMEARTSAGTSPLVPILISIVVLAAISVATVLVRRRRSGSRSGTRRRAL